MPRVSRPGVPDLVNALRGPTTDERRPCPLLLIDLIHDEDLRAAPRGGSVARSAISYLKSRTSWRFNATTIGELGHQTSVEDQYDMPPRAPV